MGSQTSREDCVSGKSVQSAISDATERLSLGRQHCPLCLSGCVFLMIFASGSKDPIRVGQGRRGGEQTIFFKGFHSKRKLRQGAWLQRDEGQDTVAVFVWE